MTKVKDGKIIKDDKKEETNFLGGKKPFKVTTNPKAKNKTLKQQRSDIIKARADRLKLDAKKQGISVEELKKKRSDTYSTVLSPLTMLPIGRGINLAGKLGSRVSKFLKGSDKTKKVKKTTDNKKFSKTTPDKTTKTNKTNKNNKKNKVTPTAVTKPKQGPFPKVYKKPVGPKPKTSTRIKNFVRKNKVPIIAGATAIGTGTALLSGSGSNKDKDKNKKKKDFGLGGTDNINLKPSAKQGPSRGPLKARPVKKKSKSNIKGSSSYDADFTRKNLEKRGLKAKNFMSPKNFGSTTKEKERKIGVAGNFNTGGKMVKRAAGGLKPVPEGNKGLGKLPQPVRNKMGYMRKGGVVKMRGGGAATRGMNFNRGY